MFEWLIKFCEAASPPIEVRALTLAPALALLPTVMLTLTIISLTLDLILILAASFLALL